MTYGCSGKRPTLSNMHYIIQPIWWKDQTERELVDRDAIESAMADTLRYYREMSWNKMEITFEILNQTVLEVSEVQPTMIWSKKQTEKHLTNSGYQKNVDYDGIILIHPIPQSGDLARSGAVAVTNGDFIWMSDDALEYKIFRHEIGHNFGHDHHGRNTYGYRNTRPLPTGMTDGFDLVRDTKIDSNFTYYCV